MDAARFRSWVFARQGLGIKTFETARESLKESGWQRSVAGVSPYLGIRARSGEGREAVDALAASLELFELPAARSCTYVVPADHFALALSCGRAFSGITELATAKKLGTPDGEVDTLKNAVVECLEKGPLSPADMKPFLGDKVRNYGAEGKKKGLSTSLPLALSLLQTEGRIRRKSHNGRLDVQRYSYEKWEPQISDFLTEDEAAVQLATLFFIWMGAATLREFRDFSLFSAKIAISACEEIGLVNFEGSLELLALPDAAQSFAQHVIPSKPIYKMVGSIDSYLLHRRGSQFWLADEDKTITTPTEKGLVHMGSLMELSSHAILDRGRLVGIWDYDPASSDIAFYAWVPMNNALNSAIEETESYVREELGDARSFSLDSPTSRVPRVEAIRRLAKAAGTG